MADPYDAERAAASGAPIHSDDNDDDDDEMAYEEEKDDYDMHPPDTQATASTTTKTPNSQTPLQLQSPPGSSPGMIMRSGRRKRRGVSTGGAGAPTPTPRKAAKRSKIRHSVASSAVEAGGWTSEEVAEREGVAPGEGKKRDAEEEKINEDGNGVGKAAAEDTAVTATAVRSGAEDEAEDRREAHDRSSAFAESAATTSAAPSHHAVQGIRLPSQRTPQPPQTPAVPDTESRAEWQREGGPAGGGGGRRLVFDPSPVAEAPSSSAVAGGMTLAQRLRWQREMQQQPQPQQQGRTGVDASRNASDVTPQQKQQQQQQQPRTPEQISHQQPHTPPADHLPFLTRTKRYVQRHFLYAFFLFILMQTAHITGMDSSLCETFPRYAAFVDRKAQKVWLADFYGIDLEARYSNVTETEGGVVDVNGDEEDSNKADDLDTQHDGKLITEESEPNEEPAVKIIQEVKIINETDPHLLQLAETRLRAQHLKEYQLHKLDLAIAQMHHDLAVLDGVSLPEFTENYDANRYEEKLARVTSGMKRYKEELQKWEEAVKEAEKAMDGLFEGEVEVEEANEVLEGLERVSLVGGSKGRVLDMDEIVVPGEGCEGMDYILPAVMKEGEEDDVDMEEEEEVEEVVVVGGIDVQALDLASDAPVRYKDAQNAYQSLVDLAEETKDALINEDESGHGRKWVSQMLLQEVKKLGLNTDPPTHFEPLSVTAIDPSSSTKRQAYTAKDILFDIDRLLEIEDADRTGKFDLASIPNGARVLRRGPRATSLSLYETLPLFNRILAYAKLRFYGHPPEAALVPSISMHPRGQCWSFQNEWNHPLSSNRRGITRDGIRGDYATLTVALAKAVFVSEVVVEHLPASLSKVDAKSAVRTFRVVGFEDVGAFGEPWELGTFEYNIDAPFSLQTFQIPSSIDGLSVPKLKAVSLAVDSNWGADYTCLYRFRVHGA